MKSVLITGATGNVGIAIIKSLQKLNLSIDITAGLRDISVDLSEFKKKVNVVKFDVTDTSTFAQALHNIDILFLLRPPQISNVKKYFEPLIYIAIQVKIKHIVFFIGTRS